MSENTQSTARRQAILNGLIDGSYEASDCKTFASRMNFIRTALDRYPYLDATEVDPVIGDCKTMSELGGIEGAARVPIPAFAKAVLALPIPHDDLKTYNRCISRAMLSAFEAPRVGAEVIGLFATKLHEILQLAEKQNNPDLVYIIHRQEDKFADLLYRAYDKVRSDVIEKLKRTPAWIFALKSTLDYEAETSNINFISRMDFFSNLRSHAIFRKIIAEANGTIDDEFTFALAPHFYAIRVASGIEKSSIKSLRRNNVSTLHDHLLAVLQQDDVTATILQSAAYTLLTQFDEAPFSLAESTNNPQAKEAIMMTACKHFGQ